jgi:ubiquinone/menaquinone biosynthesis C-methylase UbiE
MNPIPPRAWKLIFDLGAPFYGWATAQGIWVASGSRLASYFPEHSAPYVLDLGTGPGISIVALHSRRPDGRYIGLDIASQMLQEASTRLRAGGIGAALMRADALFLPVEEASIDVVTGHSFLYLVSDPTRVLGEVVRVLRGGGTAIFMEPRSGEVRWMPLLGAHWRDRRYLLTMLLWRIVSRVEGQYSPERFQREAGAAGLEVITCEPVLFGLGLLCVARKP